MSDEGKPMQAEHIFKKIVWRSTLELGTSLEQFTTWTLTGIAAIIALFISNLDSVNKIISLSGIRWALILFATSLLSGVISKQIGMAVKNGVSSLDKMEALLNSEEGQNLMGNMKIDPKQLVKEIAIPFLWPLSKAIHKGGQKGLTDNLAADKRFVKLFCFQLFFNWIHAVLAALGLIVLALSI